MTEFDSPNIYYLENSEFDPSYTLHSTLLNAQGKPLFGGVTIVMVQGNYCGYCTKLKPIFQQLANELTSRGIDFATIRIDGDGLGERLFRTDALTQILGHPLEGVPYICKFYQGRIVDAYQGEQSYAPLKQWILS